MVYIQNINCVAICGGRTLYENLENEIVLGDLFLFSVKNEVYIRVEVEGDVFKRFGFSMFCSNGDLFVFGGLNEQNFVDGNIVKVPVNPIVKQRCVDFLF